MLCLAVQCLVSDCVIMNFLKKGRIIYHCSFLLIYFRLTNDGVRISSETVDSEKQERNEKQQHQQPQHPPPPNHVPPPNPKTEKAPRYYCCRSWLCCFRCSSPCY